MAFDHKTRKIMRPPNLTSLGIPSEFRYWKDHSEALVPTAQAEERTNDPNSDAIAAQEQRVSEMCLGK